MREINLDEFLINCNSDHLERHSDSSDFESPPKIPIIASKSGNHRLINERASHTKHNKQLFNDHAKLTSVLYNAVNRNKKKTADVRKQNKKSSSINDRMENEETKSNELYKKLTLNNINKNHGDQTSAYCTQNVNSKHIVTNKAVPCLSNVLRRRNNCTKHMSIVKEDQATKHVTKGCERASFSNCEHRRVKRGCKHRRGYSVQPVYNVEEKIQGFPFASNKDKVTADFHEDSKNNDIDVSNDLNLSSTSELESINPNKTSKFPKNKNNVRENIQGFPFITNNDKIPLNEFNEMSKNNGTDESNDLIISSKSDLENINMHKFKIFLRKQKRNVENNIQGFPFVTNNDKVLSKLNEIFKNNATDINDLNTSSKSEFENMKPCTTQQYKLFLKRMKKSFEKEKLLNDLKSDLLKNHEQQYPSKFQMKPLQVFSTSSCQAKCSACASENSLKMPSSSSSFWDTFARKMKSKINKSKSCDCMQPPNEPSHECSPENCEKYDPRLNTGSNIDEPNLNRYNRCHPHSSQTSNSSKKKSKEPKVVCKCYSKKKKKNRSKNDKKPCQEDHDAITQAVSQKYNGEILCIHNPPCILINGCLNLPPPKSNVQGNLWPVTQTKKSSFVQMCRKIKRSRTKSYEQASQYHPPYTDVQEYLPEYKTEKIIQSICNHEPPCEVVHGCYKVQYDPKLQNSCVHVPMCQYLPECLLSAKSKELPTGSCTHHPKCTKLPLCSRKYITLTAKEHVGTQVKPKEKLTCRHQPHCFMIPTCVTRAISGNCILYGAIPGCAHQPSCEMTPACCRKPAKEMVTAKETFVGVSYFE
ncbi:uncharacterized protein LOC124536329 [Vanessa cardui]|uniref:uncharacterized protein LOC124536329 n=1 Tax=Vanessa cardui TaxID=171605 RepID=UPI001F13EB4A|nr:uncharacterized protein LOC124536329 [Vanessa cardui]